MTDGGIVSPEKNVAASALLNNGATPARQTTQQTQQGQDGKDAVTGTSSKAKLTDAVKETIGGYFGRKWSAPTNNEVVAR